MAKIARTRERAKSKSSERRFCAFVDLVGTKNLAALDADGYWSALETFQTRLAELCHRLDGGKIYFFSDCAFFEHSEVDAFIDFFTAMRSAFLRDRLYCKGAIRLGSLEAVPADEYFAVKDQQEAAIRRRTLSGNYFGIDAARLYSAQEQLKGIGTSVDDSLRAGTLKKSVVPSCFLPAMNSDVVRVYWDIRFSPGDLTPNNLHGLLSQFFDSKTRSRKLGRYYISLLVLWIQSLNLAELAVRRSSDEDLVSIIISGRFDRLFGEVPGVYAVYLALLNRVIVERDALPPGLYRAVWKFIEARRRIFRLLEYVPDDLFSDVARRHSINALASAVIQTPQDLKELITTIAQLRDEEREFSDIARELRNRGVDKIGGRKTSASVVERFWHRENIR
jgi:hypothetical protein